MSILFYSALHLSYQVTVSSARVTILSHTFLKNHLPSADVPYPCTGVFNSLKFVHYQPRRRKRGLPKQDLLGAPDPSFSVLE